MTCPRDDDACTDMTACPDCPKREGSSDARCDVSEPTQNPTSVTDAAEDGALVLDWHHSTRSVAAHCFENGYPLCQESDPGDIIDLFLAARKIGRTCEECRRVYKSRILYAIRRVVRHG